MRVNIRTGFRNGFSKFLYQIRLALIIRITLFVTNYQVRTYKEDWESYKKDVVSNSDYRKFDDTLRMVISGTPQKRKQLVSYLEEQYRAGKIYYGTHSAEATLLTCMVFDYSSNHFHFIDGSNGGYALAAANMKRQLKQKPDDKSATSS